MRMLNLQPRFEKKDIPALSASYTNNQRDRMQEIGNVARCRGYMTYEELLEMYEWKTVRSKSWVTENPRDLVVEATRISLTANHEQLRTGSLLSMSGIQYPTASVILHFCHPDPYPILDFRALWSLGIEKRTGYNFYVWKQYVDYTRNLASEFECTMGELDQALWQFSKEKQK